MGLLACKRRPLPEEAQRGGTEKAPITTPGQSIIIHAAPENRGILYDAPSLAKEFLEQLKLSEAPNGCVMLPGNF